MSERGYRSSNNISRNFTDSEEAIDERINEHLQQPVSSMPAAVISAAGTASQAYGQLSKDLANRDAATARLTNEFQLAGAQSIRHKLSEEAKLDTFQKEQATAGIEQLAKWRENGFKSPEAAKQKLLEDNPGYAMNPHLRDAADYLNQNAKSDTRRKVEETIEANALIKGEIEEKDSSMRLNDMKSDPAYYQKMFTTMKKFKESGMEMDVMTQQMEKDILTHSFNESKKTQELIGSLANDPKNQEAVISLRQVFDKSGIKVDNVVGLVNNFQAGGSVLRMLSDNAYMDSFGEEDGKKEELNSAVQLISDPDTNPKDKMSAIATVERYAGEYKANTQEQEKKAQTAEKFKSLSPTAEKIRTDMIGMNSKIINTIKTAEEGKKPDNVSRSAARNTMSMNFVNSAQSLENEMKLKGVNYSIPADKLKALKDLNDDKAALSPSQVHIKGMELINDIFADMIEHTGINPETKPGEVKSEEGDKTKSTTTKTQETKVPILSSREMNAKLEKEGAFTSGMTAAEKQDLLRKAMAEQTAPSKTSK